MSITFVQQASGPVAGALAYDAANAAENLLVASIWSDHAGDTLSATDILGNVWAPCSTAFTLPGINGTLQAFYVAQSKAGANTVQAHGTSGTTNFLMSIYEYKGLAVAPFDTSVTSQSTPFNPPFPATTYTFPNITTTQAGELLLAIITDGFSDTINPVTGWTVRVNSPANDTNALDMITGAAGAYGLTGTFTVGGGNGGVLLAFIPAPPAPPVPSSGLVVGVAWGWSGPKTWITGPSRIE